MCRIIILSVIIFCLTLPHNHVLAAHRTAASRHRTLQSSLPAIKPKTSSMRNRMQQVLHLRDGNSLTSMFNMDEEDPAYVFVLPDKRNKTIVFHQRDFIQMDYPKISEVGRMEGPVFYKPLNATVFRDVKANKTVPIAERLTVKAEDVEDLFTADEEEEMNRIVEENVRTERNFIKFMEDLNEDGNANQNNKPRAEKTGKALRHPQQQQQRKKPPMRFQQFGNHFHPDQFHNPSGREHQDRLEEIIRPPPLPVPKYNRGVAAQGAEDYRPKKSNNKSTKKKPGYGNIGEVIAPPFHEDSADRSDEFLSELKIVPKFRNTNKQKKKTKTSESRRQLHRERGNSPAGIYEQSHPHQEQGSSVSNGGWDDLGLEGWSGGLSDLVHEFEEKVERPPPSDIFNEGITYNRMKEMLQKDVSSYSYHQLHPSPAQPPATQYGQPQHQSYYEPIPTRDSAWATPQFTKSRSPVTQLKSQYADTEEQEDEQEQEEQEGLSFGYDPYQEQQVHQQQQEEEEQIPESHEYVPPRVRTKYPPSPYDVEDEDDEEEVDSAEYNQDNGGEESADEEYVYMINGKPISLELAQLLQNEHTPLNFTRHVKTSQSLAKWHITNSRSSHRDADVFVGRANNPFGHSTKWQWSNASSSYIIPPKQRNRGGRSKRGVPQLYSMVKCATGCDPLVYKGYGCYCGFLGQGEPLDGIDKCCKQHDNCYTNSGCPAYLEYFVPYLWKCYKGTPLCAVSHGEWGDANSCAARLCQCDLKLSMCLRRYYCPRKRNVCTASPWRLLQNFIMDF